MADFVIQIEINAPIDRCFDAARDIDLHRDSMMPTGERAVAGVRSGLIGFGETVTWEARHFGIKWRLTSEITAFEAPTFFQDTMIAGPFRSFQHDHSFEALSEAHTRMSDTIRFASPFGALGRLVDWILLRPYLSRLLRSRARFLKLRLESFDG